MSIKDPFHKKSDEPALPSAATAHTEVASVTRLPDTFRADVSRLTPITDQRVIARISAAIPGLAQAGMQAQTAARYGGKALYEAILPAGAALKQHAKAGRDMFWGAAKAENGKSLMPDFHKVGAVNGAAQVAAAAMNVASVVVGQYYMAQIDNELNAIKGTMDRIYGFQKAEYAGKIQALFNQINKVSAYQTEILLNEELRNLILAELTHSGHTCDELLSQAQQTLQQLVQNKPKDYEQYEQQLREAAEWFGYQQLLLKLQYQISSLAYTLMFGTVSHEFCFSTYEAELETTQSVCAHLRLWHQEQISTFGIDMQELTRKRRGFDALLHAVPSFINRKLEQRPVAEATAALLNEQMQPPESLLSAFEPLFDQDVHLLYDGENMYYLKV